MIAIVLANGSRHSRIRLPVRRGGGEGGQRVARSFDPRQRGIGIERDSGASRIGELWYEADVRKRRRRTVAELARRRLAGELCFERREPHVDPVSIPAILRFFARADRTGQVPEYTQIVERV